MKENSFILFADEFAKSLKVRNLADRTIKGVRWRLGRFSIYLETCS